MSGESSRPRSERRQRALRGELCAGGEDPARHALAERRERYAMRARRGVDFMNRLERRLPEPTFEPRERWPEAAVDVGHLARDEAADEHIARRSHGAREPEELLAARMSPPAAARAAAEGGFNEARHGAARSLEHDAVLGDEAEGLAEGILPLRQRRRAYGVIANPALVAPERPDAEAVSV